MHRLNSLLTIIVPLVIGPCLPGSEANAQSGRSVTCSEARTLARAVATAPPGSTIFVEGLCKEQINISTDGLTIDGRGAAVIDGSGITPADSEFNPVITIDGARGVTLRGLTVQNGPAEGVLARNAATFTLEHALVQGNGFTGIAVSEGSTAMLRDVSSTQNAIGMDIFSQSTAIVRGEISLSGNLGSGLEMAGSSLLEIRGANVVANQNGGAGLGAGNSQIAIFGFTQSQGSTITANDNGGCGLFLPTGQLSVMGARFFGSAANQITVHGNAECGIRLPLAGFIESPFATALFSVEGSPIGLWLGEGSGGAIIGGLNIHNNDIGLLADAAGSLVLVSAGSPHDITGNGTDVELRFGSRATFAGPPFVGSVVCDGTALTRGSAGCP